MNQLPLSCKLQLLVMIHLGIHICKLYYWFKHSYKYHSKYWTDIRTHLSQRNKRVQCALKNKLGALCATLFNTPQSLPQNIHNNDRCLGMNNFVCTCMYMVSFTNVPYLICLPIGIYFQMRLGLCHARWSVLGYGCMHRRDYNVTNAMYGNTQRTFFPFLLTWSHSPAKICPFHHLWSSCHLLPFYSQFPVNGGIVVIFCYGAPVRLLFVII